MTALPICAALRQCCERTAVCCTSHRCYPPFLLYTTLTLPCTVHSRVECQSFATFRVFSPLHVIYINININTRNNI